MKDSDQRRAAPRWGTSRVEAFSDGVFAIAITLLVLEIKIDPSDYGHLGRALAHEWPAYLAYVTSFLTVGSVWIAHHALFSRLRYIDSVLLRINLLLLMVAAFLPFPTGVLAEALHASNRAERVAIGFYGLTALVIELVLRAGVRYAASQPHLAAEPPPDESPPVMDQPDSRWASLSAAVYSLAIVFGIVLVPRVAVVAYLAIAIRGALVVGGSGRLNIPWITNRLRRRPKPR
jgi:uncharacterized membrane protein